MARFVPFILILTLTVALSQGQGNQNKIHNSLKASLNAGLKANVFVAFKNGKTDQVLNKIESSFNSRSIPPSHTEKTTSVYRALTSFAHQTQKPILEFIQKNHPTVEVKSFWILNQIYLKNVDVSIVQSLAARDDVSEIFEEEITHIRNVFEGPTGPSVEGLELERGEMRAEWGLENMNVPRVWTMPGGNQGEGLIIGNIDTGVRGTHELLRAKWVGLENNGWLDPEQHRADPHDVYNHGTHTMGTLVGDNGLGIAPGAKWLACKGYRDNGSGSASTFIACLEYMLCPVDYQGNNRDCSKAPHVVSNSWGWNGGFDQFNPALAAWVTAGIVSSFSAGNTGPTCTSVYSPADQPNILAIGATDSTNALASFSSLGPSPYGQLKPEVSAPGVNVRSASSVSDTAYMNASGTSMSCPMATGVIALLKNRDRNINQAAIVDLLQRTSRQNNPSSGRTCGGIPETTYPNNHIGHGIINAFAAMEALIGKQQ